MVSPNQVKEDIWIHTACSMCYAACSIMAHRVDGVIVKLEGDPDAPIGRGRMCAKGQSGIMTLYDPNRLNVPLKRTNPNKGLNEDPRWQEITWDEALDTIAVKIKEAVDEDPRLVFVQGTTTALSSVYFATRMFTEALGTPNQWVSGGGLHCGNAAHLLGGMMHGSWSLLPDFQLAEYTIYFGCSKGHSAGHAANINAQMAADARARGMKLVVFDPMCNFAAAKANEWVPIRPGTDAAVALSMANLLVNELGMYDVPYLKKKTNAPYLIGPDGLHVRDEKQRPLIWDAVDQQAKPYNDPSIKDFAMEGTYDVGGQKCQPAFALLRDHLKKYTPEHASEISGVPAETIRRIATEFGKAAHIGSTIMLDGKELPYRPTSAIYFRGSQGHKNGAFNCVSIDLLNHLVGCADMPGGALGFNPLCEGHPENPQTRFIPTADRDGFLSPGTWPYPEHLPWPDREPEDPRTMGLQELFPHGMMTGIHASADQMELWKKFNLPYPPKVLYSGGTNSVMSVGNREIVAESLKRIPFIFSSNLFVTEFEEGFADIALPDASYLEAPFPLVALQIFNAPAGLGDWSFVSRPVTVQPTHQRRYMLDILVDICARVGNLDAFYELFNEHYALKGENELKAPQKYTSFEICDRILKQMWGPERGVDWFAENGPITWPKKVEEVYWRHYQDIRVPVYFEMFKATGIKVRKIAEKYGLEMDWRHHEALPEWLPCPSHELKSSEYDLLTFYYRDTLHTNSFTMENPWLDEASDMNEWTYRIAVNAATAARKGIKDGDMVWIETPHRRKLKGQAKVSEGIHPECLGIAALCGHWAKGLPIAKGKGVFYNELLEIDLDHLDPVSGNLDLCAKVKIYKA